MPGRRRRRRSIKPDISKPIDQTPKWVSDLAENIHSCNEEETTYAQKNAKQSLRDLEDIIKEWSNPDSKTSKKKESRDPNLKIIRDLEKELEKKKIEFTKVRKENKELKKRIKILEKENKELKEDYNRFDILDL